METGEAFTYFLIVLLGRLGSKLSQGGVRTCLTHYSAVLSPVQ